ncbi:MAG: anti-sigma factor [Acidobacteriota bacterium]|nr:anti-sigma factor [Acidobacteriota bacterium]
MMYHEHISQEDLELYALLALPAEKSAAIRSHMEGCVLCRAGLDEVTGNLALVAMSVEQHPVPEGARERFIESIAAAVPAPSERTQRKVAPISAQRRARSVMYWIPWAAVAALVMIVVTLSVKVGTLNQELQRQSDLAEIEAAKNSHAREVLEVLTAPSAKRVLLTSGRRRPRPTARAVYLAERGGLILQASNLRPVPADKAYELWVIPADGSAPIPAGLFRPDAAGSASVMLPPLPKGVPAKAFGVTIERAEGSAKPTLPIILSGAGE